VVALQALSAILAALVRRGTTGRGGVIEVPMFEAMTSFLLLEQQGGFVYDPPRGPAGYARTRSPYRKPYATRDGFLGVLVYTDKQWLSFFTLIGRPELAADPRFRSITERTENIDSLLQLVAETLPTRTSAEWSAALGEVGIPCTPIRQLADLFDDEHLRAVGFFETVDHPLEGPMRLARSPLKFADTTPSPLRPAPALGQHGREVLREAGFDDAAIAELVSARVVVLPSDG
jgi:crotonobetainyl-CoA:carnitine CoA-transferase CaiB-like acyl-CoA transferase